MVHLLLNLQDGLTFTSDTVPGEFVDTICVVTIDGNGNTDTTYYIPTIIPVADIGDYVWNDENGDGVQDSTESGIEGVTVYLIDNATGDTIATTTTDADGMYLFEDVPAGEYVVAFDVTTNVDGIDYETTTQDATGDDADSDIGTNGQTAPFTFDPTNGDDLTIDAGFTVPTETDTIYVELPVDSMITVCDDTLENGVTAPTTTELCDVATTDSDYGSWTTSEEGCLTYNSDTTAGEFVDTICVVTTDTSGNVDTTIFIVTITPTADIGDYVWVDANGDGIQDSTEVGIEGVTVYLIDAATGDTIATTMTDADGMYLFEDVAAGDYQVAFDVTTNTSGVDYEGTLQDATADGSDSDADPVTGVTAVFSFDPENGDDLTIDAGFIPVADIGDYVWNDENEDGIQDSTETGVEGVVVYLIDNVTGDTIATDTTDADGMYLFEDVPAGEYIVAIDPSSTGDLEITTQDATGDDEDSDVNPTTGTTPPFTFDPTNGDDLSVDIGLFEPTEPTDTIYVELPVDSMITVCDDSLENGVDGSGVTELCDPATTSSDYGTWEADSLGCLTYVSDTTPGEFVDTICVVTTDTSGNVDTTIVIVTVLPTGNIGDYVWVDEDGDGVQDSTEAPLEGVTVYLIDANTGDTIATTMTDADGLYLFEDVVAGDYIVAFDMQTNTNGIDYEPTAQDATGDDEDSDIGPNGQTAVFSFDPTTGDDLTIDAGFVIPTIHDTIYFELPVDSNITICDDVLENGVTDPLTTQLCDPTDMSSTYGTWFAVNTGCLVYNSDSIPGDFVDTICVTTIDSDGNVDTTIFIATITPGVADIGDYVWNDEDQDGVQDSTESGIEGVTVYLIDNTTGDTIATDVTDVDGMYLFEDVPAGEYVVAFDPSTAGDYIASPQDQTGDTEDSDVNQVTYQTTPFTFDPTNGDDLTIDAGFYTPEDIDTIYFTIPTETDTTVCDNDFENGVVTANDSWLCEGGTSGSSAYGDFVVDPAGCITFTSNTLVGQYVDTICVVTYDSTTMSYDTTIFIPSITPTPDTIYVVVPQDSVDTICVEIEPGFGEDGYNAELCEGGNSGSNEYGDYTLTPEGCLIYETNTNIGNFIDSICIVVTDSTTGVTDTTIVIVSIPSEVDTIWFELPTEDSITVCDMPFENGVETASSSWLCDGGTVGMSGNFGTYVVDPAGCITFYSDTMAGAYVDSICVVTYDSVTMSYDTTIFIPSITPVDECDILPDTLTCDEIGPNGEVCLPISRAAIVLGDYLVFVDGDAYLDIPGLCDIDTLPGGYDFTSNIANNIFVEGQGHLLSSWMIGGVEQVTAPGFLFTTLAELTTFMNGVSPAENWTLNGTLIQGDYILPRADYGSLVIDNLDNNTLSLVDAGNLDIRANGAEITVEEGCQWVVVVDANDPTCVDSVYVCFGDVVADIAGNTVVCEGESTTLTASGGDTYTWSTGETGPSITITPTGDTTVSVIVDSDLFCNPDTVAVDLTVNPAVDTVRIDSTICDGAVVSVGTQDFDSTGVYTVTLAGAQCDSTVVLDLTVLDGITASIAPSDTTICGDRPVSLTATAAGATSYLWSTGDTTATIEVQPSATTDYTVTVTGAAGCVDDATVTVTIDTSLCRDCDLLPEEIACEDISETGEVCLPIQRTDIILGNYLVYVDGVPYIDFPDLCDVDTLPGGYDFTSNIVNNIFIEGQNHLLVSWIVDGVELVTSPFVFTTLAELTTFMNGALPG